MIRDLKSFLTGLAIGLAGGPLPLTPPQREPIAYLYNGVQLPPLPEWDREMYPYAVISRMGTISSDYYYRLVMFREPYKINYKDSWTLEKFATGEGAVYLISECPYADAGDGSFVWSVPVEKVANQNGEFGERVYAKYARWSNYEITYASDGALYLAASEPVPVYE